MGDMKDHIHDKVVNFSYDHISFSIQNNFRMNFSSTNILIYKLHVIRCSNCKRICRVKQYSNLLHPRPLCYIPMLK